MSPHPKARLQEAHYQIGSLAFDFWALSRTPCLFLQASHQMKYPRERQIPVSAGIYGFREHFSETENVKERGGSRKTWLPGGPHPLQQCHLISSLLPRAFRVVTTAPSLQGSSSPPSLPLGLLQHSPGLPPSSGLIPQTLALLWASPETPRWASPARALQAPGPGICAPSQFLAVW